MKKDSLPDSFKKRKLLADDKAPPERLIALGERFLEEGRLCEALDFFRKASHQEGLDRVRTAALEEADSFLLERVAGGESGDSPETWEELGRRAMERGKFSHAVRAFRKAGDRESLKEAEAALQEVCASDKA